MSKQSPASRTHNKYKSRTDTPKSQREKIPVGKISPMVDSIKTLGHPPRGRKRRG